MWSNWVTDKWLIMLTIYILGAAFTFRRCYIRGVDDTSSIFCLYDAPDYLKVNLAAFFWPFLWVGSAGWKLIKIALMRPTPKERAAEKLAVERQAKLEYHQALRLLEMEK